MQKKEKTTREAYLLEQIEKEKEDNTSLQIRLNDATIANKIDVYGFDKLFDGVTQSQVWAPANKEAYIDLLNTLKATLFNNNVYDTYRLGLTAVQYGNLVSALTSILKFETLAGVEGVDRGEVANA